MSIVCFDLEGIFTPEVWISIAEATGIDDLKLTTRDEPDYDKLMERRLEILEENNINLNDINIVTNRMELLKGAKEFMEWIRHFAQVVIVTDNYMEFINPLLEKLGFPMCFCHDLESNQEGLITDYCLRTKDMKKKVVQNFKRLNYNVIAIGDSYNDIDMLKEAHCGVLFAPPKNVIDDYPEFPIAHNYIQLKQFLSKHLEIDK